MANVDDVDGGSTMSTALEDAARWVMETEGLGREAHAKFINGYSFSFSHFLAHGDRVELSGPDGVFVFSLSQQVLVGVQRSAKRNPAL